MTKSGRKVAFVTCPNCGSVVRKDRITRHMSKQHSRDAILVRRKGPILQLRGGIGTTPIPPEPKTKMTECPQCQVAVRQDRLAAHMEKHSRPRSSRTVVAAAPTTHPARNPASGSAKAAIPDESRAVSTKLTKKHRRRARHRIFLESRRGVRVSCPAICDDCKRMREDLWAYARSTLGPVRLCGVCKVQAFERSFGSIDALDMAYSGGAFESSRR